MEVKKEKTKLNDIPIGGAYKDHLENNSYCVVVARNRKNRTVIKLFHDDGFLYGKHSISKFVADNSHVHLAIPLPTKHNQVTSS